MAVAGRLAFVPIAACSARDPSSSGIFIAQFVGTGWLAMLGHVPTVIPIIFLLGAATHVDARSREHGLGHLRSLRTTGHQRRTGLAPTGPPLAPIVRRCVRCARKHEPPLLRRLAAEPRGGERPVVATNTMLVLYNPGADSRQRDDAEPRVSPCARPVLRPIGAFRRPRFATLIAVVVATNTEVGLDQRDLLCGVHTCGAASVVADRSRGSQSASILAPLL